MSNDQSSYIEDSDDGLREQIKRANFNFPYVVDSTQELGKMFEAQCTPEFYYFNNLIKLKYRGRLDSGGKNSSMGKPELYYAIEETYLQGLLFNPTISKYRVFNKMEKLINRRNIIFAISSLLIISLIIFYFFITSQNKNEKYFDIILAELYNEETQDYDNKLNFLSNLDNPDVSFFGDLKLASIDNLDKYEKLDRDIVLLKKALLDLDSQNLKNLSLDENFIFKDIAKIFFLNKDLKNYDQIFSENSELVENFFLKAVNRYSNEIN
jgi:hypothetical protein